MLLPSFSATLGNAACTSHFSTIELCSWIFLCLALFPVPSSLSPLSPSQSPSPSHACSWTECTLSNFADNAELRGVADVLDSWASLLRDLKKLRELANRNFPKFSGEICKVPPGMRGTGAGNPMHPSRLEISWLSSNPGKDLGVTVGAALNVVQSVVSPQKRQITSWEQWEQFGEWIRGICYLLYSMPGRSYLDTVSRTHIGRAGAWSRSVVLSAAGCQRC